MADKVLPADLSDLHLDPATLAIHAADHLNPLPDVAPAIHVTTTFRHATPLVPDIDYPESARFTQPPTIGHIYSRESTHSSTALETTLTTLLSGHATTYTSGLSSFFALLTHVNPKRLLISGGYHGCHGTANLFARLTGMKILDLHTTTDIHPGDLLHLETPVNPSGRAYPIAVYAKRAHDAGAILSVDATFAPPPLQYPFDHGADWIMHSGTKYFGGHSDMLAGVLVTKDVEAARKLKEDRLFTGMVMGGLESWLGVRSLKTLDLRLKRQAATAEALVKWLKTLEGKGVVKEVQHASLQTEPWVKEQMPNGFGPVFAILTENVEMAKTLATSVRLWIHATSLGGVESLVEWRAMSDTHCDQRLLRFSVGVEDEKDLREDLEKALEAVKGL